MEAAEVPSEKARDQECACAECSDLTRVPTGEEALSFYATVLGTVFGSSVVHAMGIAS
jgi:hypothetical protein